MILEEKGKRGRGKRLLIVKTGFNNHLLINAKKLLLLLNNLVK